MAPQTEEEHQRRGPWSQREDEMLKRLVARQGPLCWVRISSQIGSRSSKQCRERYHQNLKPSLNHSPITPEEGAHIEEMVGRIGKRWAEIARTLDNRSDNAVKNWWNGSMNRRKRLTRRQNSSVHDHAHSQSPNLSSYYPQATQLPPLQLPLPQLQQQPSHHGSSSHHNSYHQTYHARPLNNFSGGLPSPSLASPDVEHLDPPPSLISHSSSIVGAAHSASSFHRPEFTLPPLRFRDTESEMSKPSGPSLKLSSPSVNYNDLRLPPIKDISSHSQLPTAPNSPQEQKAILVGASLGDFAVYS
ncbi:Homeodomain-like protein [Jackrogersella minutella]|nr:Homeodomain-like protein [Jackrogersella minutella]